ncbi:MAG: cyclopropane-fatty-acyl-phospholipid synthase family protein [Rickettsiales bacterium]|nr:cyclopropane-fatty-acyl-phospholipid synthase family protein [Rickettsiales bacterium]
MMKKLIAQKILQKLEYIEYGKLDVITPDYQLYQFEGKNPGPHGRVTVFDWQVFKNLASKGDVGFAEDYRDGLWETDNLTDLLWVGLKNGEVIDKYLHGNVVSRVFTNIAYLLRSNTLKGSKRNIHAHYDIGNEFYKLWLDPSMTYSAAVFNNENETLEQAQYNKYDRITDSFDMGSGKVLEVGCGWGGFADRALTQGDYDIKGITISNEQHNYAVERLDERASIALEDYRHQDGTYDYLVSIEMFEAVGQKFWPTYFKKMKSLLNTSGKAIVQTITIDDKIFENYRKGTDMVRSFIFPGGMLPSPERFEKYANAAGLKVGDRFDFGQDYAKTLEMWLENFEQQRQRIMKMGFDTEFIRMWRFYLAACIAGFKTDRTNVMQIELRHA